MTSFLDKLPATVAGAFSSTFRDAALVRDVAVAGSDPADPPPPTQASFACKALVEDYSERYKLEGTVRESDRKLMILAATLSTTPHVGDRVTLQGSTYQVIGPIGTDPATAVWTCRVAS